MKPPAFQFYADDFLSGTSDMTNEEVGAYMRLLCHQWSKGAIANDADRISRMAGGMNPSSMGYVLSKFQKCEDGALRNQRLELERHKQAEYRERKAMAGKKGMEKRWSDNSAIAVLSKTGNKPVTEPLQDDNPPSPSPSPVSSLQSPTPEVTQVPKLHVGGVGEVPLTKEPVRRFAPPSIQEVEEQCAKVGIPESEAEGFMAFYESNGWRVGRNPMKCWVAAVTTWKKNWKHRNANNPIGRNPSSPRKNFTESADNARARVAQLESPGHDDWPDQPPPVDQPGMARTAFPDGPPPP